MNLRMVEIVIYEEHLKVDIQETCKKYSTIKKWAYIKHDKDDTRPHYHIMLHFGGASVSTAQIAKWFNLAYTAEDGSGHSGEQFCEKIKGRWTDGLKYLIHGNDTQQSKHQYLPEEVISNFDFKTEIANAEIIGDFEHYSYAEMLKYVNTLPVSEKGAVFTKLRNLWQLQCQIMSLQTDRSIEVMFITGKAGAGKTYQAKKLLESQGYDYCISSSSNDPFQDYLGQAAIILDDLRDTHFERLEDLLKILDNNTSSSIRSRFNNKVFNGKMIVITSSVPLAYWYKQYRYNNLDSLEQLYRRISCYVVVTEKEITIYNGVDNYGKPACAGQVFKNDLAEKKAEKRPKVDYGAMFGKFCQPAELPQGVFKPGSAAEQIKIEGGKL